MSRHNAARRGRHRDRAQSHTDNQSQRRGTAGSSIPRRGAEVIVHRDDVKPRPRPDAISALQCVQRVWLAVFTSVTVKITRAPRREWMSRCTARLIECLVIVHDLA